MTNRIHSMSLAPGPLTWWLPAIAAVVILSISGVAGAFAIANYNEKQTEAANRAEFVASDAANAINAFIDGRITVLEGVAASPVVKAQDFDAMQPFLTEIVGLGFDASVTFIDKQGILRVDGLSRIDPDRQSVSYADRAHVKYVLENNAPAISGAVMGRLTPGPLVVVAVPARDAAGNLTGVVTGGFRLDGASSIFRAATDEQGKLFVVDQNGQLMSEDGPVSQLRDVGSLEIVRIASESAPPTGNTSGIAGLMGEPDEFIGFARIPAAGWTVFWEQSRTQALGNARSALIGQLIALTVVALTAIVGQWWIARTIEARMRAQRRTEAALNEALRAKDDFLGLVSHELRTPLAQVIGNAELLTRWGPSLPEGTREESIEAIATQGRRLQRLIENMLTISRLQRGILASEPEPHLLQRLIPETLKEFDARFPGTEIQLHADNEAPPVAIDPTAFDQVLFNLLTNALKYGHPGDPIEITVTHDEKTVSVGVHDRGPGIPEPLMARVFEPYFRVPGRDTEATAGLGLGLSVCKRIMESQGGSMWVRHRPGGGSSFGFTMPCVNVPVAV